MLELAIVLACGIATFLFLRHLYRRAISKKEPT